MTNLCSYLTLVMFQALGIQTVFMIDPPGAFEEDGFEGKKGGTKKQVTRTPEEIEQRRLHHLFAQNAVCG